MMSRKVTRLSFGVLVACVVGAMLAPQGMSTDQTRPNLVAEGIGSRESVDASAGGIVGYFESGVKKVRPILTHYGYPAVFLAILVEGFGIPAPGQTLLMAASIDAASGRLSLVLVMAYAFSAAVLGNILGYVIGRFGGHPLLRKAGINESRLAGVKHRFARSGLGVLVFARFFDGLRQFNGIAAGLLKMPWHQFALWNAVGAALWVGVWGLGIYFIGKRMALVRHVFKRVEPAILGLCVAATVSLLVYLLWRRGNRN
jgi:membrane protein DedA with SNARE-associated domain